MKTMKKFLSAMLCGVMLCTFFPQMASAENTVVATTGGVAGQAQQAAGVHDISTGDLVIREDGEYTVTGETTTHRIIVNSGVTATITLNSVNITAPEEQPAIDVQGNANLTIILRSGSNTLVGGASTTSSGAPGIHVPSSATLIIQGNGSLTVNGGSSTLGYGGEGIGGKVGEPGPTGVAPGEDCGTVIILSTATTVTGGIGINQGSGGTDIGGGRGSTNGDDGQGIRPTEDDKLTVYGNLEVGFPLTIPAGTTLVIPEGSSLTILEGGKLTNNGTIENEGSLTVKGEFEGEFPSGNGEIAGIQKPLNYRYYDNGEFKTGSVENYDLITEGSAPALWNLGWYVVKDNVTISERITVNGDIHLLLLDGCTLTASQGIAVEGTGSLSIYAQSDGDGMGALVADGWFGNAAIGSSVTTGTTSVTCGNITIHGGNIKANTASKSAGAAIGGGQGAAGGTVTIYGGVVEATSGPNSSGIGGGLGADSGTFSTGENGTAVIHASSIADNDDTSGWSGIIFEGTFGQVYGNQTLSADLTIPTDLTIPEGATLTIPANTTLTVPEGMTLTNNGTITGEGTLTGNGTLQGTGRITVGSNTFQSLIRLEQQSYELNYGEQLAITGSIASIPGAKRLSSTDPRTVALFLGEKQIATAEIDESGQFRLRYSTKDKVLPMNQSTLTVKYGGGNLPEASTTVTVTLNPKPVTGTAENITKGYDGNTATGEFPLTIAANDLVNSTDKITATATGSFSQKDVGNDLAIEGITVTTAGDDAEWYEVSADGVTGSIIPAQINGTVTISKDADSRRLTANYDGAADVTCQWYRDNQPIAGATETTYQPTAEDVGKEITVMATAVSGDNYTGSVTSAPVTVEKLAQAAPAAPEFASASSDSITLKTVAPNTNGAAAEYSKDGGKTWQDSPIFTGLSPSTRYDFVARYAETTHFLASPASAVATFSTEAVPSVTTYAITVRDTEHGSVRVQPRRAARGSTVTVTVTPDDGYTLDTLTVTDKEGEALSLADKGDGRYTFKMPAGKVCVSATFAKEQQPPAPEPTPSVSDIFIDVAPDAWYVDAVQFAYDEGIMTGTSATTFSPELTATRGMIVAILHRLEGSPVASGDRFTDVGDGDWYAEAVNWAASEGIVNGTSATTFAPNAPITREQLAAILYNYAEYKGMDTSARADLRKYSDAASISSWANDVMQWAVGEELISGVTNDTLVPQGQATRAQVAIIFQRFLSK